MPQSPEALRRRNERRRSPEFKAAYRIYKRMWRAKAKVEGILSLEFRMLPDDWPDDGLDAGDAEEVARRVAAVERAKEAKLARRKEPFLEERDLEEILPS